MYELITSTEGLQVIVQISSLVYTKYGVALHEDEKGVGFVCSHRPVQSTDDVDVEARAVTGFETLFYVSYVCLKRNAIGIQADDEILREKNTKFSSIRQCFQI